MAQSGDNDAIESQLIATLYRQTPTMVIGALVISFAASVGWYATRQTLFLWWIALVVVTVAGRIALERAYHARRDTDRGTARWRRRYVYGAWAIGAVWGASAFVMGPAIPRHVTLFVVSVVVVTVMGAASRNCGSVLAARGQACTALAPLIIVSVCQPDVFERLFAGAFGALFVAVLTHAHQARVQTVRFLEVSEENRKLAAELGRTNAELVAANVALAHAASTDGLTGVANRRSFDSAIVNEVRRARRERSALSLFMIDVDYFKQYNDRYGHLAGDDVLARVAAQLSALLRRPADFVARYGGEEFVAVLPQTDGAAAFSMAQELRARIEALDIPTSPGCGGRLTVSIGVTTSVPGQGDEAADFIRSADTALYAAKSSGRNCVRVGPSVARTRSADDEAVCLVAPRA